MIKDKVDVINILINKFEFKDYLEIGVRNPKQNFDKINIDGIKYGVDPKPQGKITHKMSSDIFFKNNDKKFDIILIDGLHTEKQTTKDIKNSIPVLRDTGIIVVHDCNPPTKFHARSFEQYKSKGGAWNGTVYRSFIDFRLYNPDWNCFTVDVDFGCGIITKNDNIEEVELKKIYNIITYEFFDRNRKDLLGLISYEDFLKVIRYE